MHDATTRACIEHIEKNQESDGSFVSQSIPLKSGNFQLPHYAYKTTYFTSLILESLAHVHRQESIPAVNSICSKAEHYILQERSATWTWNYWGSDDVMRTENMVPDDHDDTSLALLALYTWNPSLFTHEVRAHITKNLILCEVIPGGPYRTWIPSHGLLTDTWKDVDLVVNCTIHLLLLRLGVTLKPLEHYIVKAITDHKLSSKYYLEKSVIAFFLSRVVGHARNENTIQMLRVCISTTAQDNPTLTSLSLYLLSLISLNEKTDSETKAIVHAYELLIHTFHSEALTLPFPFCIDPSRNNVRYAGSCTSLTASYVLQALYAYKAYMLQKTCMRPRINKRSQNNEDVFLKESLFNTFSFLPTHTRDYSHSLCTSFLKKDTRREIQNTTHEFSKAITYANKDILSSRIDALSKAHVMGWIAFSLYDKILDGDSNTTHLLIANTAYRRSITLFNDCCPHHTQKALCHHIFNIIEHANAYEMETLRFNPHIGLSTIPSFNEVTSIAHKSIGHSLSSLLQLHMLGYDTTSEAYTNTYTFFLLYLTARQLHDDAHDWYEDLTKGICSVVNTHILSSLPHAIPFQLSTTPFSLLQKTCNIHTFPFVVNLIQQHIRIARTALEKLEQSLVLTRSDFFHTILSSLELQYERAHTEQKNIQDFINHFHERSA